MANSDKNIKITPNINQSGQPVMVYTGSGNVPIALKVLDDSYGTLSFEGSAGQLFSLNNNLASGTIFSVNDISGMPQFDVNADGTIRVAPYGSGVYMGGIGGGTFNIQPSPRPASGVGTSIAIKAGSGVTSGAGGSLILQAGIQATSGGDGKVIVQQVSGQTSNLQEWQNSSGSVLASLATTGRMTVPYLNATGGTYSASSPALVLGTGTGFYFSNPYIYFCAGNNSQIYMSPAGGQLLVNNNGQPGSTSGQVLIRPGNGGGAQVNCLVVQSNPNQGSYLMYTVTGHGAMTVAPDVPSVSCETLTGASAYSLTATTKSLTSNVATITVSGGTPRIDVGDTVVVALSPADAVFDGTYTISAKSGTNLSYARTNTDVTSTATGGTVSSTATATLQNINIGVPGAKGSVIKGAASQTANLQEWQNSAGTALAYVNASGSLFENIINAIPIPVAATVTAATGNGTTVTYTCANTFSVGQIVSVTGLTITTGASLNIANMTIATVSSTQFTVTNATVGTAAATQAGTATIQSAGNSLTLTAGNGSGVGAGGNIILQPGAQGTSGGNGKVLFYSSAGAQTGYWDTNSSILYGGDTLSINSKLRINGAGYIMPFGTGIVFATSNTATTYICTIPDQYGFKMNRNGLYGFSNDVWGSNWTSAATDSGIGRADFGVTCVIRDTAKNGGSLSFPSTTTNFSADTNDLALTASAFQRINCTVASSLTGIAPPTGGAHVNGRMIRIYNVGTANLTLSHNSTSSAAANRFFNATGTDIILAPNDYAELIYDSTSNGSGAAGWRVS